MAVRDFVLGVRTAQLRSENQTECVEVVSGELEKALTHAPG
jgi:hypothetical protein